MVSHNLLIGLRNLALRAIKQNKSIDRNLQLIRRRLQSMGVMQGFSRLGTKLFSDHSWRVALDQIETGKKILVATSLGSHLAALQMETALLAALLFRNASVHALLCDGVLPACQLCEPRLFPEADELCRHGPQRRLCGDCFSPGKQVYAAMGIPLHRYGAYLDEGDYLYAASASQEIALADINELKLAEIRVGEHATAGALRYFARSTLDDEPCGERILRLYLEAAILTARVVERLLEKEKYEVLVFHHGIYVPQGVIGEVARKLGVKVVNWNPAYRKHCFIFSHGDTYHHTLMSEPTSAWESMPWNANLDKRLMDYLRSRWRGESDWIRFTERPYFEKNNILAEIGCDPERTIIGLLTNVAWDAQLHYPANAFPNMLEWLLTTIRYFERRQDLQLVIRVHPAEIRGSVPTRQPVVDMLKDHFGALPGNVYVVPPESEISTYSFAELCDSVLIYGTKTGVELSAVGIPVIVAGEAWIRNKGITEDATSPESYRALLDRLPLQKRLPVEVVERARKYAYHFFFRRMIPVGIFNENTGSPPYLLRKDALERLKPGADPGVDCICNGILYDRPFVFDDVSAAH